jgi:YCII-related domain
MAKFVFAYVGGSNSEDPSSMQAWVNWFGELGSAVSDMGAPTGPSIAVRADGSTAETTAGLRGYSVIEADSLDAASILAKGCPIRTVGGSVEVYQTVEM